MREYKLEDETKYGVGLHCYFCGKIRYLQDLQIVVFKKYFKRFKGKEDNPNPKVEPVCNHCYAINIPKEKWGLGYKLHIKSKKEDLIQSNL